MRGGADVRWKCSSRHGGACMNLGDAMTTLAVRNRGLEPLINEPWPRIGDWLSWVMPTQLDRSRQYAHAIRVEEFRRNGDYVVRAEIPGCDPEKDIDVSVSKGMLTIEASREEKTEEEHRTEFTYGEFMRAVSLPSGVDEKAVNASYENGILEVTVKMPKEALQAPRRIEVKRGSSQ